MKIRKQYIVSGLILIFVVMCAVLTGWKTLILNSGIFLVNPKMSMKLREYNTSSIGILMFLDKKEKPEIEETIDNDIISYRLSYEYHDNIPENVELVTCVNTGRQEIVGETYSYEELNNLDFLRSHFYTITSVTSLNNENFNVKKALDADLSIEKNNDEPQILIFHSHSQERFVDSIEGDYSTYIVGVGDRLTELLRNEYGYNVIHDTTTFDILDGTLDRGKAYTYANQAVDKYLEQYPSIKVILDVHRDGVDDNLKFVTDVDGRPTAKVMFFNGISYTNVNGPISYLANPYVQDNLAMSLQMHLLASAYYPDYARRIYIQGYRYSQHHAPRSMLIEVGAQTNTVEEELNAMEPLADLLDKLLSGQKVY